MLTFDKKREINPELEVSLEEFKIALGSATKNYTEEQMEEMRVRFDKITDLVFDAWLAKRNSLKSGV